MIYGAIATVHEDSIEVPAKMLEPIGIFPASKVSGLYLPNENKNNNNNILHRHDLLFTPIHYKVWPFVVRLTINLKQAVGTLEKASEILKKSGINILYAECNRTTHDQATWNVIGEFEKIKDRYKDEFEKMQQELEESEISEIRNRIQKKIRENIRSEIKDEWEKLKAELKNLPEDILYEHTDIKPSDVGFLYSLAHYYTHQVYNKGFIADCIESNKISLGSDKARTRLGKFANIKFPTIGFAACDLDNFTLRIAIIEQKYLDRFIKLEMDYERKCNHRCKMQTSRGFLHIISKEIANKGINMWQIHNLATETTTENENGAIQIVAELPEELINENKDDLERELKNYINKEIKNLYDPYHTTLTKIKILSVLPINIFISLKQDFPQRDEIKELIEEVGRENGISKEGLHFVEDNVHRTSEEVMNRVNKCDAMICIFSYPKKEPPEYRWLEIEYALARASKKKVVRIVNTELEARPIFEKDIQDIQFDFGECSKEEMKKEVRRAFRQILKKPSE